MKIFKILFNPRVATAIVSAIGAIVSALCAGCQLCIGELAVKDFNAEIFGNNNSTNKIEVK